MKEIEDEIPFEAPEGWARASLSQIAELFTGKRKEWKGMEQKHGWTYGL